MSVRLSQLQGKEGLYPSVPAWVDGMVLISITTLGGLLIQICADQTSSPWVAAYWPETRSQKSRAELRKWDPCPWKCWQILHVHIAVWVFLICVFWHKWWMVYQLLLQMTSVLTQLTEVGPYFQILSGLCVAQFTQKAENKVFPP